MHQPENRLSTKQLAERWGKKPKTLRNWRYKKIGPNYTQIGTTVYYELEDIIAYERAGKQIVAPQTFC